MNIVLVLPIPNESLLPDFVEGCIQDKIALIAICGTDADKIEDEIDRLIVGDGSDNNRFICTTSHFDEEIPDVVDFATAFGSDIQNPTKVVRL